MSVHIEFAFTIFDKEIKNMGLLSIIRKLKQKERETRILILGLDNAGKTTCVAKLSGGDTSLISPTLGFNISTLVYKSYKLNLWYDRTHV